MPHQRVHNALTFKFVTVLVPFPTQYFNRRSLAVVCLVYICLVYIATCARSNVKDLYNRRHSSYDEKNTTGNNTHNKGALMGIDTDKYIYNYAQ